MLPKIGHQMTAQGLHIHDFVFDSACKGKYHASVRVLKFRPQDARCVQQIQGTVHVDPLLAPGNAGAVPRLSRLLPGHLIDKGGLSHVGDSHHHGPHRTAYLALLPPF